MLTHQPCAQYDKNTEEKRRMLSLEVVQVAPSPFVRCDGCGAELPVLNRVGLNASCAVVHLCFSCIDQLFHSAMSPAGGSTQYASGA
jgi:hypothetical protein